MVDRDRANAIETTPLIAQYDDSLPDDEKESIIARTSDNEKPEEDEPTKDKTHRTIILTALGAGMFSYVLFTLLYPLLARLTSSLLSFMLSSRALDDGDGDYAMNPLSFGIVMFLGWVHSFAFFAPALDPFAPPGSSKSDHQGHSHVDSAMVQASIHRVYGEVLDLQGMSKVPQVQMRCRK